MENKLVSVEAISERLGISAKTVYAWIHTRSIPFIKVGRLVKFDLEDIEAWIQARKIKTLDLND